MKNVILVSIDTLRFDCVGYQPDKSELINNNVLKYLETPTFDEIASKSVCFTHAISTSTYTTSAHASILTGLYPPKHGVRAFYDTKLFNNIHSIVELFKDAGYITILATDIIELFKPLDLTRGFSHIFIKQDKDLNDFLEKNKDKKIFLFIHFFDVHEPYLLSDFEIYPEYNFDYYEMIDFLCNKYDIKSNISKEKPYDLWNFVRSKSGKNIECFFPLYVKGVTKFDKGRFKEFINHIQNLRFLNNSLLMIFSDHGEGKCDEMNPSLFSHGGFPYENVIRIPLIIHSDGIEPKLVNDQVSIIDLFPSILETVLNKKPEELLTYTIDGKNLMSTNYENNRFYVQGEVWGSNFNIYATDSGLKTPKNGEIKSVLLYRFLRREDKKYLIFGKPDLFLDISTFDLPNEDFIKELYHCLLGRIEDEQGFNYHVKSLNQKILSKKDILTSFLKSEEYKLKKMFVRFDMENDPEEMNPIYPLNNPFHAIDYFKHFDIILSLEKQAVRSEKIFGNNRKERISKDISVKTLIDKSKDYTKEDETKIKERLKSLGYFD